MKEFGFKSRSLSFMLVGCLCLALIAVVAFEMNNSIDKTGKYTFKALGLMHRKRHQIKKPEFVDQAATYSAESNETDLNATVEETTMFPDWLLVTENVTSDQKLDNRTFPTINEVSTLNKLLPFSSFDCFLEFPQSITDYINTTFLEEYIQLHKDINEKEKGDIEQLPLLESVRTTCFSDQNCTTYFEYDKQYGINTSHDNVLEITKIFYCCPFKQINTTSEICKYAEPVIERSLMRESKNPLLLVSQNFYTKGGQIKRHSYFRYFLGNVC